MLSCPRECTFIPVAVRLMPDLDQVPALAAERDQQWGRITNASFLTDAEKRMLLGLPKLADDA